MIQIDQMNKGQLGDYKSQLDAKIVEVKTHLMSHPQLVDKVDTAAFNKLVKGWISEYNKADKRLKEIEGVEAVAANKVHETNVRNRTADLKKKYNIEVKDVADLKKKDNIEVKDEDKS